MTDPSPRGRAERGSTGRDVSTEPSAGAGLGAGIDADQVVALELLEATLARLRGQPSPCYPRGEQTLLAAAQTLLEVAGAGEPTTTSLALGRW